MGFCSINVKNVQEIVNISNEAAEKLVEFATQEGYDKICANSVHVKTLWYLVHGSGTGKRECMRRGMSGNEKIFTYPYTDHAFWLRKDDKSMLQVSNAYLSMEEYNKFVEKVERVYGGAVVLEVFPLQLYPGTLTYSVRLSEGIKIPSGRGCFSA